MTNTEYNGYKNYETWNVALWIQNAEKFYLVACECTSYLQWLRNISEGSTPDGVNLFSNKIDVARLDELIYEM